MGWYYLIIDSMIFILRKKNTKETFISFICLLGKSVEIINII